jgi:hypothetical protein
MVVPRSMPCFILTLFVRANRYLPCIRALKSERTRAIHDNGLMALHALKAIRDVYFHGDMEAAPALAGQSAGLIDKIKSAQQIIEETVAQFFAITPTRPASPQSAQHFLSPRSRLFAAAGASWVVGAACAVDSSLPPHFCRGCGARSRENQFRLTATTILGTDSTRSFYFAVQQLFVLGRVRRSLSDQGVAGVSRQEYRISATSTKAERYQWLWPIWAKPRSRPPQPADRNHRIRVQSWRSQDVLVRTC